MLVNKCVTPSITPKDLMSPSRNQYIATHIHADIMTDSSAMYMVEDEAGTYGYVLLMNTSTVESVDDPWTFSIKLKLQDLILDEAHRLYQALLNQ